MQRKRRRNGRTAKDSEHPETVDYVPILDRKVVVPNGRESRPRIVRGIKVDFSTQRVVALLVSEEGRPRWQVSLADVVSLERQKIAIVAQDRLEPLNHEGGRTVFGTRGGIIGSNVVSAQGRYLGKIVTFRFHPRKGAITRYEMSRGVLKDSFLGRGVLSRDQVISASPEKILVSYPTGTLV